MSREPHSFCLTEGGKALRIAHKEQRTGWEVTLLTTTHPLDPALITPLRLTLSNGSRENIINVISQPIFNLFNKSRMGFSKMSINVTPLMQKTVNINSNCVVPNNSFFMVSQLLVFRGRFCVWMGPRTASNVKTWIFYTHWLGLIKKSRSWMHVENWETDSPSIFIEN